MIEEVAEEIRNQNKCAKIFMYTAKIDSLCDLVNILIYIDGITVTLHRQRDIGKFTLFVNFINFMITKHKDFLEKSYRVNIFENVYINPHLSLTQWRVKNNMKRIKNCPLPDNEVFKRLK